MLTVDQNGLAVHAPWRSSLKRIEAALQEGERWVLKKLEEWSRYPARRQTWADGDALQYLGRALKLEVVADTVAQTAMLVEGDRLRIALPEPGNRAMVLAAVVKWYRRHALLTFTDRVAHYAPRLGVPVPRLFLSSARTRWGSCNARREVRLNWRLIQAPQPTVDYVVVHELCHLIEMNHSRRFWQLVEGLCPGYRDAWAELERMGLYYMDI